MNMVIVTLPPSTHERLSAGMLARNQTPRNGIKTIGARNTEAWPISSRRASRSSGPAMLITTQAARAAIAIAATVRYKSDGQKLGLKKPDQTLCVTTQRPGVSWNDKIPLIQNRLNQAATE